MASGVGILRTVFIVALFTLTLEANAQTPRPIQAPPCPGCDLSVEASGSELLENQTYPTGEPFCSDDAVSKIICKKPLEKAHAWSVLFCRWFATNKDSIPPDLPIELGGGLITRNNAAWYCDKFFPNP